MSDSPETDKKQNWNCDRLKKIQIEVTISEETLKDLFAAVALHKLMPQQQVSEYVTSAIELAGAMMRARKEEAK